MNCVQHHSRISIRRSLLVGAFSVAIAAMTLAIAQPTHAQTYTIVHAFAGGTSDGAGPNGELIQDAAGNFYGTTQQGGAYNYGSVFRLDPSGVVTILNSFTNGADGGFPYAGLFLDPTGNLYGTTGQGGDYGLGTFFKLDSSNILTTLYSFKGGTDGSLPWYRLVSINGVFYGTTLLGGGSGCGGSGCGTIFKITKGGLKTILYRFTGGTDGGRPQGLVRDSAGNLYSVTSENITAAGAGTVFKLDASGVFSVLYTFTGGPDGGGPMGRLVLDANGNFHGATATGGDPTCNCGVVFRLDANGNETVIHKFFGGEGGSSPSAGLLDVGGILYGTTLGGVDRQCTPGGCGVLYQIAQTGKYSVLHSFAGSSAGDGDYDRFGTLTLGTDGSIYGATVYGGIHGSCGNSQPGCGVIFRYTP
jgi:uncharacterized repeat protein (TIGR03803 family)